MTTRNPLRHIILTTFIALVGFGMMIPLLPLFARQFGGGGVVVGALLALNQLVDFFFAPYAGRLSDRVGRRPLLLGALFITAIAYLLVGYAGSLTALVIIWTLAGFGSAQVLLSQAYIADVTNAEGRTRGMGLWGAAYAVGFVVGPPTGAMLFDRSPLIAAAVAAGFTLLATLYALVFVVEPARHKSDGQTDAGVRPALLQVLKPVVVGVILLYFVVIFVWSKLTAMLALYGADEYGWTVREYGKYLGLIGLVAAIIQGGLIGRLAKMFGRRYLVLAGFALLGTGMILLTGLESSWMEYLSATLIAIGFGLLMPTLPAILSLEVAPERKGQALGIFQSASTLARVLAPLVAGFLYDRVTHSSPFVAGGIVSLATVLVALFALGVVGHRVRTNR
ncbi:MFS transporter [bacterium]|nr:MFS transporter [bacterium]